MKGVVGVRAMCVELEKHECGKYLNIKAECECESGE